MAASARALVVRDALAGAATEDVRGGRRIVLDSPVGLIRNKRGDVIGVDAWVRLFEGKDEVPIDPHRIVINPPTHVVVDGREGIDVEQGEFVERRTVEAPQEAFWEALWDSVTSTPNPRGWRTRGTVTTIYSSTADGYLESSSGGYTIARAGGQFLSAFTGSATIDVGQRRFAGKDVLYYCIEGFLSFDTSTIDDSDDVTDVSLSLWLTADNSVTDFTIEAREQNWGASLETGDFVAGASLSGLTLLASLSTSGIGGTGAYKAFTSEAAFTSATNLKTGTVYVLLSSSRLRTGDQPSGNEYVSFSSADQTGTTQDPKLTITHGPSNTAPTANAGSDQTVDEGDTVNLDGSGSTDPEDGAGGLTYAWSVLDDGGTGLTTGDLTGANTDSASFVAPEVDADTNIVIQLQVTDSGSLSDTDTVTITVEDATLLTVTGAGGLLVGGAAQVSSTQPVFVTGSGGVEVGGSATCAFIHGGQVPSNIVVEWDLDNDGDFDEPEENITSFVLSAETLTGRDWPSLLTGKAGPGTFRATLRNDDDRFSYFNASSPLVTSPFSLKTGRKLRVRTVDAGNPDPAVLARDRFRRANGPLGVDERGNTWSSPLSDAFALITERAVATNEGEPHIGIVDAGAADYYAQATIVEAGLGTNVAGLVFRYQDSSNYSLFVLDVTDAELRLVNVVAGTPSEVASKPVEVYDRMTVGVLLSGSSVTGYLEGVPVLSAAAVQTDETEVGIYAEWGEGDNRPAFDDFHTWDGLPQEVEGILWTGDVSDLVASVQAGPEKFATLTGQGWLSRLTGQQITAPASVAGRKTGLLVGNVLAKANLLHPPGSIAEGDVTTGLVGIEAEEAVEVARRFEETEFGFLYESQEGPICFAERSARDDAVMVATFTDAPGGQFGYHQLTPYDWRKEIVNRVFAGVSPKVPSGVSVTEYAVTGIESIGGAINAQMPAIVEAGDLLIAIIALGADGPSEWFTPNGWTELTSSKVNGRSFGSAYDYHVYGRIADGDEGGNLVMFGTDSSPSDPDLRPCVASQVYRITDWFGAMAGVHVGDVGQETDTGVVFPPWGLAGSMFLAVHAIGGAVEVEEATATVPLGYGNQVITQTALDSNTNALVQTGYRFAVTTVEHPEDFAPASPGTITDESFVIAIRGANGDPPQPEIVTIQADNPASQDDHNAIRTHRNASNLFASVADAEAYADLVLATYADDRPILALSFYATKSAAYRAQAVRRRVSDKIRLVADYSSGFGIDGEFFIESISHRWSHGTRLWETTWELSPA